MITIKNPHIYAAIDSKSQENLQDSEKWKSKIVTLTPQHIYLAIDYEYQETIQETANAEANQFL